MIRVGLQHYLFLHKQLHDHLGTISNRSTGTKDGGDAGFIQEVIVLCGDDTTCGDHDVGSAEFLEFLDDLRDKGLMTSCSSEVACNVLRNHVSQGSCRTSSS